MSDIVAGQIETVIVTDPGPASVTVTESVTVVSVTPTQLVVEVTETPTTVTVQSTGLEGPQGPPGSGLRYEYVQSAPATTWIINHNLGIWATTTLFDDTETQVYADVTNGSVNQTTVSHPSPRTGRAILE